MSKRQLSQPQISALARLATLGVSIASGADVTMHALQSMGYAKRTKYRWMPTSEGVARIMPYLLATDPPPIANARPYKGRGL
jgi:hypothetical protein